MNDKNTGLEQATSHGIELRLHDINQLFNSMDPSPFREKELDAQAEEFIVSWAMELPRQEPPSLTIHLEKPPGDDRDARAVNDAVRNYFSYRAEQAAWQNRQLLRQGWKNLTIGLAFLATCLFAAQFLGRYGGGAFIAILRESLIIGGWVAMWRPMEIFLYDRWPIKRKQKLYNRLSQMEVRLSVAGQARI
ncbi:hypothetical protein L0152_33080 [bacterium]|nr:hypothetical protein [bacterium]